MRPLPRVLLAAAPVATLLASLGGCGRAAIAYLNTIVIESPADAVTWPWPAS